MKFTKRRALFAGLGIFLAFIAIEGESYGFARLSIANGNSYWFYKPDIFDISDGQLASENSAGVLGWPRTDVPRAQSPERSPTCGAAFGDSMTRGDEVQDNEAWVHLLSERLGCNVSNFGVGGHGLDQTTLRYEQINPPGHFVLLGLFIEMLRRDLAASWTFYQGPGSDNLPHYSMTKPMFVMAGDGIRLISRPSAPVTREAIEQHHEHDFFSNTLWTPLSFPYSYSAGRAIFRRLYDKVDLINESSNIYWSESHPSRAGALAERIIARMLDDVRQRKQRMVVVMIPQVEETLAPQPAYSKFMQALGRRVPDLCIIDTYPALTAAASRVGMPALRAPQGHYTAAGSIILAETVHQGLQRCGISGA
ncbi:hypothetical protein [Bradyrhizobium canariense]|uniref:hypothetical protein n=1 Tax=Bradyrhizobium canariense TaxID=255045 RepID=UPI001B8A2A07|nr:hypothetical protein [Bradyrhizobium canariense]MBR0953493.1 hypothetical protein [Bradyrhizobium canariense]